jgi:hypothetical protein
MKVAGRRVAIVAGAASVLVLAIAVVILRTPILLELAYKDLLANDLARRNGAAEALRRSGWEECLQRLLRMKPGNSYQVFLQKASMIVPPLLVDREWKEVQELLRTNNFEMIEHWDQEDWNRNTSIVTLNYLLKRGFLSLNGAVTLDLILEVEVRTPDPELPGMISRAGIALFADLRKPLEEIVKKNPFPEGTVLAKAFDLDSVKRDGAEWPILKGISVKFDLGSFSGRVDYTASLTEDVGNKWATFFFESRMESFEESSTLIEPKGMIGLGIDGGSYESWHGVQANKKKYLRKMK